MQLTPTQIAIVDQERAVHIRRWAVFVSLRYIIPLFLSFGVADFIWYPALAWQFLGLRVVTVLLVLISCELVRRQSSLRATQWAAVCLVSSCTIPLNIMVYLTNEPGTPYYAGLILTTVGVAAGLRFSWKYYAITSLMTIIPITMTGLLLGAFSLHSTFWLNLLFLIAVTLIMTVTMFFNERLHLQEFMSRMALQDEVLHRDGLIKVKTAEGLRLQSLSKQFSPQIIHSMQNGSLNIGDKVHRAEICAIFVDIVGSTDKFVRLDREDLQKIIAMYMEDIMGVFLKYDLTIDKFLGDGVLAFSNDPAKQDDYIDRVMRAAFEANAHLAHRRDEYNAFWLSDFEISIGISTGYASVGFYGSDKHVKSYTAIGKVINLAARLCSHAKPNEILVSRDVLDKLKAKGSPLLSELAFENVGTPVLKGFEADKIIVYSVKSGAATEQSPQATKLHDECPNGHGVLHLAQNVRGQYELKCRFCNFVLGENEVEGRKAA